MRDNCPNCGSEKYRPSEGCGVCLECGFDLCSPARGLTHQKN